MGNAEAAMVKVASDMTNRRTSENLSICDPMAYAPAPCEPAPMPAKIAKSL
jgi:hypothetical protein